MNNLSIDVPLFFLLMNMIPNTLENKEKYVQFVVNGTANKEKVNTEINILNCDDIFILINDEHKTICRFKSLLPVITIIKYSTIYDNVCDVHAEIQQKSFMNIEQLKCYYPYITKYHDYVVNTDITCPICLTNDINVCFENCGHVCCSICAPKIDKCHYCKTIISKKIKIFI